MKDSLCFSPKACPKSVEIQNSYKIKSLLNIHTFILTRVLIHIVRKKHAAIWSNQLNIYHLILWKEKMCYADSIWHSTSHIVDRKLVLVRFNLTYSITSHIEKKKHMLVRFNLRYSITSHIEKRKYALGRFNLSYSIKSRIEKRKHVLGWSI